jgi:membrane fusion protein, copper/silver efflux system
MTVSPERLQAIGVKFEVVKRQPLDRIIRTVGQVEIDERRLAHVNIMLEGWIDDLFVNSTGQQVKKGQKLFTLYSPELVATQTEYLLALQSQRTLGGSAFPEAVEGAKSLLEVTRRRLKLWDITEVLSAMLLTLIVIPALYVLWRWHTDVKHQSGASHATTVAITEVHPNGS